MEKYTNDLIHESSPYLLQHAHNPVNWIPWSEDVYEKAKNENKLVLVSVGYSACHWCHVMEHESFEDEEVAALMNKFFINVKVDREERPDVDQVYMSAVQLMTNKGGWPLNCFTLPDGRPIYGGTYFPKEQWMHILKSLNHSFKNEYPKVEEYAINLHNGIKNHELISEPANAVDFKEEKLDELILRWSKSFDKINGGETRAPKFPLPNNYEFLLDYALNSGNKNVEEHVELSLNKMAMGGIYDQIGGGFARYSVDMLWKIPHFEKMLYDNGQLISLYAKAYKTLGKPVYKKVVYETVEWLEREMSSPGGGFYSAIDADSEGVEGKFYVWTEPELKNVLGKDYDWVKDFYNVNQLGYWEEGNYVLIRNEDELTFANKFNWSNTEFDQKLARVKDLLLSERGHRIKPGIDDKCLTSWNALTLTGMCEAYSAFDDEIFLFLAQKTGKWIVENQMRKDGGLWRSRKNDKSTIKGFLEDYALTIEAFIQLYLITNEELWVTRANGLLEHALKQFFDENSGMFYFTENDTELIARKMDLNDNVLPASNSTMARNLYYLGKLFHRDDWSSKAKQMLMNMYDGMEMYGSGFSNWAILLNHEVYSLYEFVCVGAQAEEFAKALRKEKLPFALIVSKTDESSLPIFDNKHGNESLIYVCTEGTCLAPVSSVTEAVKMVIQ